MPPEIFFQQQAFQRLQIESIKELNEFLVDTFVRTRRALPDRIIIDLDPTDVTAHGHQQLTFWYGYYDQNQCFPMLVMSRQWARSQQNGPERMRGGRRSACSLMTP